MKKLILTLTLVGGCLAAQPALAQDHPMHHHVVCHHREHGQHRAGTDRHGCPIYRSSHH